MKDTPKVIFYIFSCIFVFSINIQNIAAQGVSSKYNSEEFINENITKRGYGDHQFLTKSDKVVYYWVKSNIKRKLYGDRCDILAIHEVEPDEKLIEVKPLYEINGRKVHSRLVEYSNRQGVINFFKKKLLPHLGNVKGASILHFVAGDHTQIVEKHPSDWFYGIEDPILKTSFYRGREPNNWKTDPYFTPGIAFSLNDVIAQKERYAENKKRTDKIREEDRRIRAIAKKEEALAKEEIQRKKNAFLKANGYEVKDKAYWEKFGAASDFLQYLYMGDFNRVRNSFESESLVEYFSVNFLNYIVSRIDGKCEHLLPKNYVEKEYELFIQGKSQTDIIFPGGEPFLVPGEKSPDEKHNYKYRMHPKFVEEHEKAIGLLFSPFFQIKAFAGYGLENPLSAKKIVVGGTKGMVDFLMEVKCDAKTLHLMGENILRFRKDDKSLQAENGVKY